jgi:hypothetical protein
MLEDLSRQDRTELESALHQAEQEASRPWSPSRGEDPFASCIDRRAFLRGGAGLVGGLALSTVLQLKFSKPAFASGEPE